MKLGCHLMPRWNMRLPNLDCSQEDININTTENLVTVMYCNEIFAPNKPDTYFEKV